MISYFFSAIVAEVLLVNLTHILVFDSFFFCCLNGNQLYGAFCATYWIGVWSASWLRTLKGRKIHIFRDMRKGQSDLLNLKEKLLIDQNVKKLLKLPRPCCIMSLHEKERLSWLMLLSYWSVGWNCAEF